MRLVAGALAVILGSSLAFADEPRAVEAPESQPATRRAKVPFRVVKLLPDSNQALLFDRNKGTHVLVEPGMSIGPYVVESVDEDEVTLVANGAQIVLAAPDQSWQQRMAERIAADPPPVERSGRLPVAAGKAAAAPVDPYAEPSEDTSAPEDPYGDPPVRSVSAPHWIDPGSVSSDGVRSASAGAVDGDRSEWDLDVGAAAPTAGGAAGISAGAAPTSGGAAGISAGAAPTAGISAGSSAISAGAAPTAGISAGTAPTAGISAGAAPTAGISAGAAPTAGISAGAAPTDGTPATSAGGAPTAGAPTTGASAAPAISAGSSASAAPAISAGSAPASFQLSRAEVDTALADFAGLTSAIQGSFTPSGVKVDAVREHAMFAKAGLRAGDLITAVDGKPLRSLDDAAELYARASAARAVTVQVVRGGKPLTLQVTIR